MFGMKGLHPYNPFLPVILNPQPEGLLLYIFNGRCCYSVSYGYVLS